MAIVGASPGNFGAVRAQTDLRRLMSSVSGNVLPGQRGHFDFGWLNTHHTFSFGQYHDPSRTNFGALRVLNDDTVAAGEGFGTHPHRNMEIIVMATAPSSSRSTARSR